MTPQQQFSREQSVKLENSPKTPALTMQSRTFLSASEKAPHRPLQAPEPRTSSLSVEPMSLPPPVYDFGAPFSIPLRNHYENHDPHNDHQATYEATYYTEVE
jgi:hypothetical protein